MTVSLRGNLATEKGILKSQVLGKGTYNQPASIQEAVATKPKRKSFLGNVLLREDSRGIANPDKGDLDEWVVLKNSDPHLTPCTRQ